MSQPYLGEIRMFAGNFPPAGWMFCDGATLSISDFDALFALIGTTYGGDGEQSFNLPNLQSRVPIHMGQGNGLSNYQIGQNGGAEQVTLSVVNLPSHTHTVAASSAGSGSSDPTGNVWASSAVTKQYSPIANAVIAPGAMGSVGLGQPHDNLVPYLCVSFIISLFGVFPSQT